MERCTQHAYTRPGSSGAVVGGLRDDFICYAVQDGTIVSITVSFIICVVWTLIAPEKDKNAWARYKNIEIEDGEQVNE